MNWLHSEAQFLFYPRVPLDKSIATMHGSPQKRSHAVDPSHLGHIVFLHNCVAVCAYLSVDLAAWDLIK